MGKTATLVILALLNIFYCVYSAVGSSTGCPLITQDSDVLLFKNNVFSSSFSHYYHGSTDPWSCVDGCITPGRVDCVQDTTFNQFNEVVYESCRVPLAGSGSVLNYAGSDAVTTINTLCGGPAYFSLSWVSTITTGLMNVDVYFYDNTASAPCSSVASCSSVAPSFSFNADLSNTEYSTWLFLGDGKQYSAVVVFNLPAGSADSAVKITQLALQLDDGNDVPSMLSTNQIVYDKPATIATSVDVTENNQWCLASTGAAKFFLGQAVTSAGTTYCCLKAGAATGTTTGSICGLDSCGGDPDTSCPLFAAPLIAGSNCYDHCYTDQGTRITNGAITGQKIVYHQNIFMVGAYDEKGVTNSYYSDSQNRGLVSSTLVQNAKRADTNNGNEGPLGQDSEQGSQVDDTCEVFASSFSGVAPICAAGFGGLNGNKECQTITCTSSGLCGAATTQHFVDSNGHCYRSLTMPVSSTTVITDPNAAYYV